jgi:hypothetical protein
MANFGHFFEGRNIFWNAVYPSFLIERISRRLLGS